MERERAFRLLRSSKADTTLDAHTHSGTDNYNILTKRYPTSQSIADLVLKLKSIGIDYAVNFVAPASYFYFDFKNLASWRHSVRPAEDYPYQSANRQMMYEIKLFGEDKIFPFFTVFPGHKEDAQAEELDRLAKADTIFGLKLHTTATKSKATDLINSPLISVARKHSLPFLIHSKNDEYADPIHVIELAKNYPDLRFCIAHAAMFKKSIFKEAQNLNNVFLDVVPFRTLCKIGSEKSAEDKTQDLLKLFYENPIVALTQLASEFPDKILWGTDEPWTIVTNDLTSDVYLSSYKDEFDVLNSVSLGIKRNISRTNTLKFLFG